LLENIKINEITSKDIFFVVKLYDFQNNDDFEITVTCPKQQDILLLKEATSVRVGGGKIPTKWLSENLQETISEWIEMEENCKRIKETPKKEILVQTVDFQGVIKKLEDIAQDYYLAVKNRATPAKESEFIALATDAVIKIKSKQITPKV